MHIEEFLRFVGFFCGEQIVTEKNPDGSTTVMGKSHRVGDKSIGFVISDETAFFWGHFAENGTLIEACIDAASEGGDSSPWLGRAIDVLGHY